MTRVPANVIEAMQGSHQLGIFLRLDIDEPLRVWLGVNDIPAGIASVDPTTRERYIGGGFLREVPNLEAVINGVADRADFMISGIDPRSLDKKLDIDAIDVRGRDFHVGITTLDDYYQPMSAIIPLITGRASYLFERMPPVSGDENETITVGLSVGFGVTTRDRNSSVLWSSVHQEALWKKFFPTPEEQAAHPRDRFCDNTPRLERGAAPSWPRF